MLKTFTNLKRLTLAFVAFVMLSFIPRAYAQTTITVNGSTSICQGDSVLLTASSGDTYVWSFYGVPILGETNQTYWAKQAGDYSVTVIKNLLPGISAPVTITVSTLPSIFINASSTSVCSGTPVSLSLSGNNNALNAVSFNSGVLNLQAPDYAQIPHQSQLNTGVITLEAWVRPQQSNTAATIISKLPPAASSQTGYAIRISAANKFQFVIGNETTNSVVEMNNAVSIGPWYHITATYDGSTARLYVNGSQVSSSSISATLNSTFPITLGNQNSLNAPFKGLVDELRIWNQVKAASDIQCNYKVTVSPTASNLVGYWRMNELSSNATPDVTSYHNNGIAYNSTVLTSSTAGINNLFTWNAAPGITNLNSSCITVTPQTTTTYVATATNAGGCSVKDSANITIFPSGQPFNVVGGGVYCTGTAGVPVGLSGSEVGVSYQLKNGASNIGSPVPGTGSPLTLANVTTAGTFTVIAVNANCTNSMTGSVSVTVANSPSITGSVVTNAACNGGNTGSIDVSVSGGTPSYAYSWSNNAVSEDLMNVSAGLYKLTVTDAKGCTAKDSFTVNQPTAPVVSATVNNVTCNGLNNGSIILTTGGTPPYTFSWSNNATTQNITNLAPGNYSVLATDSKGCTSSQAYTISQPAVLSLSAIVTNVGCSGGNNGSIDLTVTGGTAPYTYQWNNNSTAQDPSGLSVGTYSVTVTDAHGCTATSSFAVAQPAVLTASAAATNASCFNGNTGSINLTVTGGNAPYTYLWSNNTTAKDPAGLAAGTYNVIVTDAKGCTATTGATISQPSQITVTGTTTNVNCFAAATGAVNISVTGGTPGYTYSWSTGATTQNISNVVAGTHTVTVTDTKGCTAVKSFTITQPSAFVISKTFTMPTCHGDHNGAIDITPSGGAGPFNYNWSTGATTQDITNVGGGNYTLTVSYANGCSYSEIITLPEPGVLTPVATAVSTSCNGNGNDGGVNLNVTGGTAPYTYVWSNSATTQNISGIGAGTYSVNVTDAHGCTASASATVAQPVSVTLTGVATNVSCYGAGNGNIDLVVASGVAPFTYQWSNNSTVEDISSLQPGTYSVFVTDDRNCTATTSFTITQPASALTTTIVNSNNILCNGAATGNIDLSATGGTTPYTYSWSNGANTQDLTLVPAGAYSVIVSDANGCLSAKSLTLTQPAAALAIAKTVNNITCNGQNNGSVDLTVTGGVPPYNYSWNNSATTQGISNLAPGTYSVTVTDANGCTATSSSTITQPALLSIAGVKSDITCNGANNGNVTITIAGGTAPYTYHWSNNATTKDITGLAAGNYTLTVTDAKGCTATGSYTIAEPAILAVTATAADVTCFGGNNGAVTLTVTGGNAPYTYQWSNNATTQDLSGITAGSYNVFVTDAKGCVKAAAASVTQPTSGVAITGVVTDVTTFGGNNGSIDITVTGGVAPYTYQWSTNLSTEDQAGLIAGTYTVTVTDDNGCSNTASFTVNQAAEIFLSGVVTDASCNTSNGSVALTVTGGVPPYTFDWGNNITTQNLTNVGLGIYTVVVTDSVGSIATETFTVNQGAAVSAIGTVTDVKCFGQANGNISLDIIGGVPPFTYSWSNNATTRDIDSLISDNYTVQVTDSNGCTTTETFFVGAPAEALVVTGNVGDVYCHGGTDGTVASVVTGGTEPYHYLWTATGDSTEYLNDVPSGNYELVVTDDHGCVSSSTFHISEPDSISLAGVKTNITCNGANTGAVAISVSGGMQPYTYSWSNGDTTKNLVNAVAGTYTLTLTDDNGCIKTKTFTLTQTDSISIVATIVNNNCYGNTNGSIVLAVSGGGGGPFTYHWNNNSTASSRSNLAAGTYTVTVTAGNGCSVTRSYTITQPAAPLALTGVKTNVICKGGNNGAIDITVTGGTAPYTYSWNGGITTEDRANLVAGTYSVTVTDAKGCSANASYTITEPAQQLAVTGVATNPVGSNNGSVNITVTGGVTPYSFTWSNGAHTEDIAALGAGTYTVTVTDANGCVKTATFTLVSSLNVTATVVNAPCNANGSITLSVSGGTTPYSFNWGGGITSQNRTGLSAGTYAVTVTDANNAVYTGSFTVLAIDSVAPVIAGPSTGGSVTQNPLAPALDFNVFVQNNATLSGSQTEGPVAIGGNMTLNGSHTMAANNAGSYMVGGVKIGLLVGGKVIYQSGNANYVNQNAYVKIGDSTGSKVWYKDQNNAYSPMRITFGNNYNGNPSINMQANSQQLGVSATVNPVFQSNIIDFAAAFTQMKNSATGMSAMADNASLTNANGNPIPHTNLPTQVKLNMNNGTNVLNISGADLNAVQNFTFNQQPAAGKTLVVNVNAPGSFTWNVYNSGGIGTSNTPYIIYNFYNTTNLTVQGNGAVMGTLFAPYAIISKTNSQNISGQIVGQSYTMAGGTNQYATFSSTITTGTSSTIAQNSTVNRKTGTNNCSYTVSGTEFNATATDNCGTPNLVYTLSGATTGTGTNLAGVMLNKGTTTITWSASDAVNTTNYSFTVVVADSVNPTAIAKNITVALDANGNATVAPQAVDNGSSDNCGNLTYALSKTSFNAANIGANPVVLTVTDASGNTATANATITIVDNMAPVIACPASVTASCNTTPAKTGTATATDNAGGSVTITYTDVTTGNTIARTWKATDASNNVATCTQTITVSPLNVNGTVTNVSVYGGSNGAVTLNVSGGVQPLTYNWGNNITTQNRTGLTAGTYSVTVTDAAGCTATGTYTVTQPAQLAVTGAVTNVNIFGNSNGAVNITVTGGVTPYTYSWSNNATTEDLNNVAAGTYTVTVTDANGATKTATFTVTQPAQLAVTGVVTNVTTYGGSNGAINITATGGVTPYSYTWSNGSHNEDLSGIIAGTYTVTVTDANGAVKTATFTVTQPVSMSVAISVNPVYTVNGQAPYTIYDGYGPQSVTLTASITGGVGPFTYSWTPSTGLSGANTANPVASPNSSTTYIVTVTDAYGTIRKDTQVINVIDVNCGNNKVSICHRNLSCNSNHTHNYYCYNYNTLCISSNAVASHLAHGDYLGTCLDVSGSTTDVACKGGNTGAVNLSVTGGVPPYTYSWSNNATTKDITGLAAGIYTVTVTAADGRMVTQAFTVNQPASALTVTGVVANTCYGTTSGSINQTVTGGNSPYHYLWNNNATSQDRSNLGAGTYSVVVTDDNGCAVSKSYTVTQPASAITITGTVSNVSCKNGDNGAIVINVTGGTGPYTYSWDDNNSSNNSYNSNHGHNCHSWWSSWCNNHCNNNNGIGTTKDLTGVEDGTYIVTVADAGGCTKTATFTVTEPAAALSVTGTVSNACAGGNNGSITQAVAGGTAPYTYAWSNSNVTTKDRTNLSAGSFSVNVTDAKGCTASKSYAVSSSTAITATAVVSNTCYGAASGSINQTVSGGTSPYTYAWSNSNVTTQDRTNLAAGTYPVSITDAKGCSISKSYTVTQPSSGITISAVITNVSCNNNDNGAINITVTGGAGNYTYNWTDNSNNTNNNNHGHNCHSRWSSWCYSHCNNYSGIGTSQDISGVEAGGYTVVVTDASGCTKTASFTVTEPAAINAGISVSPQVTVTGGQPYTIYDGYGPQSVTLSAAVSGGTPPYTYSWSGSGIYGSTASNVSVSPTSTKTYTLTITDAKGCTKTVTRTINVVDIGCGNNKVTMCHNGHEICVSNSAVAAHLAQGDYLGDCNNNWGNNKSSGDSSKEEVQDEQQDIQAVSDIVGKNINVYPNPSEGIFTLQLPAGVKDASIMITDMSGRLIERRVVNGVNTIGFDLSHVAKGTYSIRVTIASEVYTTKLVLK